MRNVGAAHKNIEAPQSIRGEWRFHELTFHSLVTNHEALDAPNP